MKIREKGLPPKEIAQMLGRMLQDDLTFTSGRIVGSMCTEPARFARRLYSKYLGKNLGDPGLFPRLKGQIEQYKKRHADDKADQPDRREETQDPTEDIQRALDNEGNGHAAVYGQIHKAEGFSFVARFLSKKEVLNELIGAERQHRDAHDPGK